MAAARCFAAGNFALSSALIPSTSSFNFMAAGGPGRALSAFAIKSRSSAPDGLRRLRPCPAGKGFGNKATYEFGFLSGRLNVHGLALQPTCFARLQVQICLGVVDPQVKVTLRIVDAALACVALGSCQGA